MMVALLKYYSIFHFKCIGEFCPYNALFMKGRMYSEISV